MAVGEVDSAADADQAEEVSEVDVVDVVDGADGGEGKDKVVAVVLLLGARDWVLRRDMARRG
jgi:hypothetical protein